MSETNPLVSGEQNKLDLAPDAEPREGPTRRSTRRWAIAGLGVLLCGLSAGLSWWMNPALTPIAMLRAAVAPTAAAPQPVPVFRYGYSKPVRIEDFTPEVRAVFEKLEAEFNDLATDVDQTEQRLSRRDPHLATALADPSGTPLRGENPILQRDISIGFVPEWDAMVDDYISTTTDDAEFARRIAEPIRRVFKARTLGEPIVAEDLAELIAAQEAGADDPLLLLCLSRGSNVDNDTRFQLLKQAQVSRAKRKVCPRVAALISSTLMAFYKKHSSKALHDLTEVYIADTVQLWQQYPSHEAHFAAQDFFIKYVDGVFNVLNGNGKIDLLLAVSQEDQPPVAAWIPHYIAFRLLHNAASTYRGGDYISRVKEDDLNRFRDLATQATNHLLKAWTIAPEHPLFASSLLSIEKWSGTTPRSEDAWFRHALSARFQTNMAFQAYESSTEPKWGGSFEKQIWLADKYVETEDLDSFIPIRAMHLVWSVAIEKGMCERIGMNLPVRRLVSNLVRTLKTYSRETVHHSVDSYTLAMIAIVLWEAGEFEDLDWLMRVYSEKIDCDRWFHEKRLHANEIVEVTRAVLNDKSSRWLTIYRNLYGDTRRLTISNLEQTELALAEAREFDDGSRDQYTTLLDKCDRRVNFLRRLMNQELITLSDEDLQSWLSVGRSIKTTFPNRPDADASGDWDKPEQATDQENVRTAAIRPTPAEEEAPGTVDLRIWVPGQRGTLVCPVEIAPPLSFSMDVEVFNPGIDPYGIALMVGPTVSASDRQNYMGPILTLNDSNCYVVCEHLPLPTDSTYASSHPIPEGQNKYTIKIEAFPDGYRTFLGDQVLETVRIRLKTGGLVQIGRYINMIYSHTPEGYVKYRISNVQLQKLDRPSIESMPTI